MTTTDNRLADPVSLSRMQCTSSHNYEGFVLFLFKIVLFSVTVALAISI